MTLRQKEIGIRMALGAALIAKVTRAQLYGVSPVDPVAFGGATIVLLITMLVASLIPARRGSRVDPITVLRQE